MSWLFSRALVEGFLEENSLAGEPCARLNVMPTQRQFWRNDKTIDVLIRSPFGVTWKPLTESRGTELLTWFLAGFPVKTSVQQEEERVSLEQDQGCGKNSLGSLAKYDLDTCSWRTPQFSLLGGLELFSETWPRWGSMRSGECWGRSMPAHLTSEKEYGLWLTPKATDTGKGECQETFLKRMGDRSEKCAQSLPAQVNNPKTWPTPTVWDSTRSGSKDKTNLYQTSSGSVRRRNGTNNSSNCGLVDAVRWPTPIARDSRTVKGGARPMNSLGTEPLVTVAAEAEQKTDGRLNPEWVEWLMGWPMGWTDLKPLEMDKFQQWQRWHGRN